MDGADGVYPASEDTHLLIDALHKELPFIKENVPDHPLCIEIGSGSGDVTQTLTSLLPEAIVLATDVNILASAKTSSLISSGTTTHSTVDVIMADLFSAFTSQTKFDIIIFNPPYVPTDEDELERALTTHDISAAWAGGRKGRYVIDKFLKSLPSALSSNAVAYLVLLKENDPVQISGLATKQGLSASIVLHRQSGIESLYIMRFYVLY